jgi:NADH-quinone oxidoreductase subunit L
VGTLGAILTAFYAFRIIFRCFGGQPNEEARELERGHLSHVEPFNPATGEPEDTDVGFPGPEHHIAERERPMAVPMLILSVLAIGAGILQIPGATHVVENFLDPSFLDSKLAQISTSTRSDVLAVAVGAAASLTGIAAAYVIYVRLPGTSVRLAARMRGLHAFLFNKWYFDELYDVLFVRPVRALGETSSNFFERNVIQGIVGGTALAVRAGNSFVRVVQSGLVRYYALMLLIGVGALGLYFLVVSR